MPVSIQDPIGIILLWESDRPITAVRVHDRCPGAALRARGGLAPLAGRVRVDAVVGSTRLRAAPEAAAIRRANLEAIANGHHHCLKPAEPSWRAKQSWVVGLVATQQSDAVRGRACLSHAHDERAFESVSPLPADCLDDDDLPTAG